MHLQEVGREYGTTTGRRRRCGWLDLVVMKHSCLINGYDSLNLTKLDVLDDLEEIKVGVKYLVNGQELPGFPGTNRLKGSGQYELLTACCRSRLGYSRTSRSGLRCAARVEDVDLRSQVVRRVARELPEVCRVYRRVFGCTGGVDWSWTWAREHAEKVVTHM